MGDWFSDNAPKDDWFAANAPDERPDFAANPPSVQRPGIPEALAPNNPSQQLWSPTNNAEDFKNRAQQFFRQAAIAAAPGTAAGKVKMATKLGTAAVRAAITGTGTAALTGADDKLNGSDWTQATKDALKQGAIAATGEGVGTLLVPMKATPKSPVNPARKIMEAIGPADANMNSLQEAVEKSHGNIARYIRENKLPINSRMDYVNAAKAYADEQKAFYKANILDKIGTHEVNAPIGFGGRTVGEGTRTTINDLESRLSQINAEQANMRNTINEARSRQALSRQGELTSEAAAIRETLNNEIAKRTNLTAEQVSKLRQSFGAPHTIADQTLQTINNETAKGIRADRGTTTLPEGRLGFANQLINKARGGPVKIGDKQFLKAFNEYELAPSHVPEVQIMQVQPKPGSRLAELMAKKNAASAGR